MSGIRTSDTQSRARCGRLAAKNGNMGVTSMEENRPEFRFRSCEHKQTEVCEGCDCDFWVDDVICGFPDTTQTAQRLGPS